MVHVCLVQDGALGGKGWGRGAWYGAIAGHQSHRTAAPKPLPHKSVNSVYEKYKNKTFWCGMSCGGCFDLDDDATLSTKT